MSYRITYGRQAERFLERLPKDIARRVLDKIEGTLPMNPIPQNAEALQGEHGTFRIRVGSYRVLYGLVHERREVVVLKIDKRSRVYD